MGIKNFEIYKNKVVIRLFERPCFTGEEVVASPLFREILKRCLADLSRKNSQLLNIFGQGGANEKNVTALVETFKFLAKNSVDLLPAAVPGSAAFLRDPHLFSDFIEYLYNYWRSFERFIICDSDDRDFDRRPYRAFNDMAEPLSHLIRIAYRDIQEHLTESHPRIYRQVNAGAEVGVIATPRRVNLPTGGAYDKLQGVPVIRQILLYPPLILNPPMNKRTGKFEPIASNPLELVDIDKQEWLCYPAKVGPLVMLVYFHKKFFELGLSLCNLFEMADDEDLKRQPDAVYTFGTTGTSLDSLAKLPTVYHDDQKNNILVGAVPGREEFGYFGYLKKMILTLHNIKIMKNGRLPFHGALVRIILKGNKDYTFLFIGDTGAGKSETLEAFRNIGEEMIQDIIIVADDMGSFDIAPDGSIIGYGTEIGAFLRLDDLQPGYALGQIDRAIIMNANQVNARIILPVTSFHNLIKGHKIDFILYANNYEQIDEEHPVIEKITDPEVALEIFREGTVMSKGTTTSSGIVHSYFANVFGPAQHKDMHEPIAQKYFHAFFKAGVFIGQIRTRLGLAGWERQGPQDAAKDLLTMIQSR